eukprot:4098194-Prymnesium_polylepis.1
MRQNRPNEAAGQGREGMQVDVGVTWGHVASCGVLWRRVGSCGVTWGSCGVTWGSCGVTWLEQIDVGVVSGLRHDFNHA